ncbi:hypothetical protein LY78DRAFT_341533 [Colletotrichum sublineola]|nr:hypothetical protein LY78DRAFT_341533 [Colletotrichum sublineola]
MGPSYAGLQPRQLKSNEKRMIHQTWGGGGGGLKTHINCLPTTRRPGTQRTDLAVDAATTGEAVRRCAFLSLQRLVNLLIQRCLPSSLTFRGDNLHCYWHGWLDLIMTTRPDDGLGQLGPLPAAELLGPGTAERFAWPIPGGPDLGRDHEAALPIQHGPQPIPNAASVTAYIPCM